MVDYEKLLHGLKIASVIFIILCVIFTVILVVYYFVCVKNNDNNYDTSDNKTESFVRKENYKKQYDPDNYNVSHIADINYQFLDSQIADLLQHGKFQGVGDFYEDQIDKENYQRASTTEEKNYLSGIIQKTDTLLDNVVSDPFPGTTTERWQFVKKTYKQNIKGLTFIEQYLLKQFAYTKNKGDVVKLCTNDDKGFLEPDVNMYVLLHEITHIYDTKYLDTQSHDEYFWVIFSKLVMRAVNLGLINPENIKQDQCRCNTDIIKASVDYDTVQDYAKRQVPVELRK